MHFTKSFARHSTRSIFYRKLRSCVATTVFPFTVVTSTTLFACSAQASEKFVPIHLKIRGVEAKLKSAALSNGKETFVPIEVLKLLGIDSRINRTGDAVIITLPATAKHRELALARPNGKLMLPIARVAEVVDGAVLRPVVAESARAGKTGDTVFLLAKITAARLDNGTLKIQTSFPVPFRVHMVPGAVPARGFVDCVGAVVSERFKPAAIQAGERRVTRIRSAQNSTDVARVVLDLADGYAMRIKDNGVFSGSLCAVSIEKGITGAVAANTATRPAPFVIRPPYAFVNALRGPYVLQPVQGPTAIDAKSDPIGTGNADDGVHDPPIPASVRRSPASHEIVTVPANPNAQRHPGITAATPIVPVKNSAVVPSAPRTGTAPSIVRLSGGVPASPPDDLEELNGVPNRSEKADIPADADSRLAVRGRMPSRAGAVRIVGQPIEIQNVSFTSVDEKLCRVELTTNGKPAVSIRYLPGTTQMVMDLPNTRLRLDDPTAAHKTTSHPLVRSISVAANEDGRPGTRVIMDMSRVAGFAINTADDHCTLELRLPRNAYGVLADKTIVVDAGHGGAATGATGHNGVYTVYEKDVTLAIALKLRAALEASGARVVMTRDHDADVSLNARPGLANGIGADLFISIHNDSNGAVNSASGTSTYYHMSDWSSRALATCVQHAVMEVTGLPSRGILSDTVMYSSGFAVLRGSQMPAVLCEVAYINNSNDLRHLLDPSFQQRVAVAMCDGIRAYIEGRPTVHRATSWDGDSSPSTGAGDGDRQEVTPVLPPGQNGQR